MNIWVDGYEANVLQRVGSGQVAYELIKGFWNSTSSSKFTILLPSLPLPDMPQAREGFEYRILKPRQFWTRFALPLALYTTKQRPDVFFSPTHYSPKFSPVKRVMMVFDLGHLYFPQVYTKEDLYKLKNWTEESLRNAEHVITISQSAKRDIIKFYGLDKNKITVSYPGKNDQLFKLINDPSEINTVKIKYGINNQYLIFIGTIQPRKNLKKLIEAMSRIDHLGLNIVGKASGEGKSGWMYEEVLELPKKLGIEERVKFLGFVPDEDLPLLLSGALAYIQPSLYEGFGIPVVEAMACGLPPLVANVASLPEIVGDAGLLFDPMSVDQMEQAIRTITTDKKIRDKLSKKALSQSRKFSWEKMSREVLKVLEAVAKV